MSLPWPLQAVCAAVVLGEPAMSTRHRVQVVYQITVVFARKRAQQVTLGKYFGPRCDIICNDAIARLRKRLRHARRARETVEHCLRLNFLSETKNVRHKF